MFITLIKPRLKDVASTTDRFNIRLTEPEAATNGRLWLNLSYRDIDEALSNMRTIVNVLERIKDGKMTTEFTNTNLQPH